MTTNTLQQRMALDAHKRVTAFRDAHPAKDEPDKAIRKKYGTRAHKLPILIHTAGLAQALAFVRSRGNEYDHALLDDLAGTVQWPGASTGEELAKAARQADLLAYMMLTRRVLAALVWYKRFAESVLKVAQKEAATDDDDDDLDASPAAPAEVGHEQ